MSARPRRIAIIFGILLGLLAVAGLVADRVGAYAAEQTLASEASREMQSRDITSASEPDVSVGGFPFVTQVLRGRYDRVTIAVDKPQSGEVKLDSITLIADGVHAPLKTITSKEGSVTADRVTGTVVMNWDAVRALLQLAGVNGIDPSLVQITGANNTVEMRAPFEYLGTKVTITASGSFTVANGAVRLQLKSVSAEGTNLPGQVKQAVADIPLSATLRVPAMPYELTVERVATSSTGLVITASAAQVLLTG